MLYMDHTSNPCFLVIFCCHLSKPVIDSSWSPSQTTWDSGRYANDLLRYRIGVLVSWSIAIVHVNKIKLNYESVQVCTVSLNEFMSDIKEHSEDKAEYLGIRLYNSGGFDYLPSVLQFLFIPRNLGPIPGMEWNWPISTTPGMNIPGYSRNITWFFLARSDWSKFCQAF